MSSWRFVSLPVSLSITAFVHAQVPARPIPEPSSSVEAKINPQAVLRSETRLVQLNVIVQNGKGNLVEDLKKEDFTLLDNGKPQDIALFSSESAAPPATGTNAGASEAKSDLAPNVFGNRLHHTDETPGSVTVILFDALNTSFSDQAYARTQILAFLRQLQPQDHVAVYLLTTRLMVVNEFTQDSKSLLQAVERFQASPSLLQTDATPSHFAASDSGIPNFKGAQRLANMMNGMNSNLGDIADVKRVEITAHAIEAIANHVTGIPGRKNLVWVSGSFPLSISLRNNDDSPVDKKSQNFTPAIERVARALNQSNLAIYPVDARGLISNAEFDTSNAHPYSSENPAMSTGVGQDEQLTMKLLAERTGGHAFSNTNDIKGAIRRTLADSRFTYVLGYYPDHGNWNGEYHTLVLRVKKSGAVLRYRKGYFALADPPNTLSETQDALQAATWSPVDATSLGIKARIETIHLSTRQLDLRVSVEAGDLRLSNVAGHRQGNIDAIFTQLGPGDQVVAVEPLTYKVDFSEQDYQAALERGYELKGPLSIHSSARVLRVVVRDAGSGKLGSVTIPLEIFLPTRTDAK